ncbi:GNAT family N-acetyltransferase [Actinomadura craniellae]|uniref:GNAT family N-acetyltransferase n=2 Tax=Actinomadura craniellae TaxID=2231787 RepID=A0A365HAD4_9ACTN|nr:GNAT family N-acetyltransferase [Actinomadura craniellae]
MEGVDVAFLPEDFDVPTLVAGPSFRIRPLTVHDVVKDYDAVMSTREMLWEQFGERFGWPGVDLTLEQALIDIAWLQKEGQLRRSFTYAVLSVDEERMIGRIQILPPRQSGVDAGVLFWMRRDVTGTALADELTDFVEEWAISAWPFKTICFPGRDLSWSDWLTSRSS